MDDQDDDERQRRVEAMRELAAEHGESAAGQLASSLPPVSQSPTSPQRQPSRSPLRWIIAIVVLLALVIGGVYAATQLTGKGNGNATPAASAPAATLRAVGDFTCALPPAWSPDGKRYAVLGASVPCSILASQPSAEHQAIVVVDASTGAITRRIALAPYLANLGLQTCLGGITACPSVILWSPDGSRLALGLASFQRSGALSAFALLVIPVNGGAGIVIHGPLSNGASPSTSSYRVFDLTTKTARARTMSPSLNTANSLSWTADGRLTPSHAASPQPVGNPDGGATFSPWQPAGANANDASKIDLGSPYPFGAWSPDGRFVTLDLRTHIHVYPGAADTTNATPDTTGPIVGRVSRDAALTAVIADLAAHPDASYMLAWDDAGAHLLAVSCASANTARLTVRSTATGAVETTATLSFGGYTTSCQQSTLLPSWSPDGAHVLLVAPNLGAASVWTPKLA